jgi:hypothetical protein
MPRFTRRLLAYLPPHRCQDPSGEVDSRAHRGGNREGPRTGLPWGIRSDDLPWAAVYQQTRRWSVKPRAPSFPRSGSSGRKGHDLVFQFPGVIHLASRPHLELHPHGVCHRSPRRDGAAPCPSVAIRRPARPSSRGPDARVWRASRHPQGARKDGMRAASGLHPISGEISRWKVAELGVRGCSPHRRRDRSSRRRP